MTELITYDTIRKAHRAEKQEIALQKLPDDFFALVRGWLAHRQSAQKGTASLLEIENAKKLLEDLVNRRQKKIVIAALHTIRGDVPPQNMAPDEEKFFDILVDSLRRFKRDAQERMFGYDSLIEEKLESARAMMDEMKSAGDNKPAVAREKPDVAGTEEASNGTANGNIPDNETKNNITDNDAAQETAEPVAKPSTKRLKITADMPSFVDAEMRTHGPFKAGAIAELPNDMAQILLARKAAEAV